MKTVKNYVKISTFSICEWKGFTLHKGFIYGLFNGIYFASNGNILDQKITVYTLKNEEWTCKTVDKNSDIFHFLVKGISKRFNKGIEREYSSPIEIENYKREESIKELGRVFLGSKNPLNNVVLTVLHPAYYLASKPKY